MKSRIKHIVDLCMTIALFPHMAQMLIGEEAHEWIGAGMFALVIAHNILNWKWYRNLFRGKYSAFRILQVVLDLSVMLALIGLMVSGIMMSRYVFAFLSINSGIYWARTLHMLSAYWGFVLMSLHVGLHVNMMIHAIRKTGLAKQSSRVRTVALRGAVVLLCAYGIYAFVQREIGSYMFLRKQFVFFDFNEPLIFFFVDYAAIMGLFICCGHYMAGALKKMPKRKRERTRATMPQDQEAHVSQFIKEGSP